MEESFANNKEPFIVDYGCGSGYLLEILKDKKFIYYGYDINAESIKQATVKYKNKDAHFVLINKKKPITIKQQADIVVLIGVLQYMSKLERGQLFLELKERLKPDGTLIFSCASDHFVYRVMNITGIVLPNQYIQRKQIIRELQDINFRIIAGFEKGLFLTPLFSQIMICFDLFDKILFHTRGELGPIGTIARSALNTVLQLEYRLNFDYGYTLFIKAKHSN